MVSNQGEIAQIGVIDCSSYYCTALDSNHAVDELLEIIQ